MNKRESNYNKTNNLIRTKHVETNIHLQFEYYYMNE